MSKNNYTFRERERDKKPEVLRSKSKVDIKPKDILSEIPIIYLFKKIPTHDGIIGWVGPKMSSRWLFGMVFNSLCNFRVDWILGSLVLVNFFYYCFMPGRTVCFEARYKNYELRLEPMFLFWKLMSLGLVSFKVPKSVLKSSHYVLNKFWIA